MTAHLYLKMVQNEKAETCNAQFLEFLINLIFKILNSYTIDLS